LPLRLGARENSADSAFKQPLRLRAAES